MDGVGGARDLADGEPGRILATTGATDENLDNHVARVLATRRDVFGAPGAQSNEGPNRRSNEEPDESGHSREGSGDHARRQR